LYPDYAEAWNNMRWVFEKLNRHEEAKRARARAIEIDPDMVNPDYCNAKEAARGGNKIKALENLRAAIKHSPETIDRIKNDPVFKDLWEH
jgi:tetratricopeptide (TPR) repeat protein